MPDQVSNADLSKAVLNFVQAGTFPETELITSADLRPSSLPTILHALEQAKLSAEKEIQAIARTRDPKIDDWVTQAKTLQSDISRSKQTAREILDQASQDGDVKRRYQDAATNVALRRRELEYTQTLIKALEEVRRVRGLLDGVDESVERGAWGEAVRVVGEALGALQQGVGVKRVTALGLLEERGKRGRDRLRTRVQHAWEELIRVDPSQNVVFIGGGASNLSLEDLATISGQLDLLDGEVDKLHHGLDEAVLVPLLGTSQSDPPLRLSVTEDSVRLTPESRQNVPRDRLLKDLLFLFRFLHKALPSSIHTPLFDLLLPQTIDLLKSTWLDASLPTTLNDLPLFEHTLTSITTFASGLDSLGLKGSNELTEWIESVPKLWLAKQRELLLFRVRQALVKGGVSTRIVERAETQTISSGEDVFAPPPQADDWDSKWEDDEEDDKVKKVGEEDQEEDVSAWGLDDDDDDDDPETGKPVEREEAADDVDDAWGAWGDEDEQEKPKSTAKRKEVNGHEPEVGDREVTLRETYTITSIPDEILAAIKQVISDAESLSERKSSITPASPSMQHLPPLALALYRALAPQTYPTHSLSGMHIYNDTTYLLSSLTPLTSIALTPSLTKLTLFSAQTYTSTLSTPRRILSDLLDGAQGFSNCTTPPYSAACTDAIAGAVGVIRSVAAEWRPVLSRSALLQSVGSLLGFAVAKIVVDVGDLSDISEEESSQLVRLFGQLGELEGLFLPDDQESQGEERVPLTAVYCPSWLRFQYLESILESSLADILFLWTEGELRLEFGAEEVVELILALFADSEHRRRAVAEIRRGS
ncbi:MAG: hypothetical protein M1814_003880 [Vezdaea aestivalis]|nr:MAG: hypothetical protein M1814_003880 [Vezdaea aestivalis]